MDFVCVDNPTATKFTIHILAEVAEAERDMIAARMREAFAAVRCAGKRIGNPDLDNNRKATVARAGVLHFTHRDNAPVDAGGGRNIRTASGGRWYAMQVHCARRHLGLCGRGLKFRA